MSTAAAPIDRTAKRVAPREIERSLDDRLLKLAEVKEIVGLGKTMIYRLEREGKFPPRCKPGGAASRWSMVEVMAWRDKIKAERAA